MIQENYDYLADQLKFAGFPEELKADLKQKMEAGEKEFKIEHAAKYGQDDVKATLNFSKSKETDMYFFNNYDLELKKFNQSESTKQTFYINKGGSITLKEGYNLMDGRAVNKNFLSKDPMMRDGAPVLNENGKEMHETYNVWLQLDFKQTDNNGNFKLNRFSENYGFDIEAAISKLPIKENENQEYKNNVIESLKKGNRQAVTFLKDGTAEKRYLEANPQFKSMKVFDEGHKRVNMAKEQSQSVSTETNQQKAGQERTQQQSTKNKQSQGSAAVEDEGPDMPKKGKRVRQGAKPS